MHIYIFYIYLVMLSHKTVLFSAQSNNLQSFV